MEWLPYNKHRRQRHRYDPIGYRLNTAWNNYKQQFGKMYYSEEEHEAAKNPFVKKVLQMESIKWKFTLQMAVNNFTHWSEAQLATLSGHKSPKQQPDATIWIQPADGFAPERVDRREKGFVPPVRNQFACGACWAFASLSALYGQVAKVYGTHRAPMLECHHTIGCSPEMKKPSNMQWPLLDL